MAIGTKARRRVLLVAAAAAVAALATLAFVRLPSGGGDERAATVRSGADRSRAREAAPQPLRYDVEYPAIGYSTVTPENRVTRFAERLAAGEVRLDSGSPREALARLLAALEIGTSSQALVFSKTSLQTGGIDATTPRAIYFNDDTYVAWVQGTDAFEIATMDPNLGPVFYTLGQDGDPRSLERQLGTCLRCHDSYSLTGGGVPRFIVGSGYTDADGRLVAHEGWILTSDRTPLKNRWGGWYVSGYHGTQVHLGNVIIRSFDDFERLDSLRVGNREDLDGLVDTSPYLTNRSDIVALMILEHQVHVQNAITRVSWDVRDRLAEGGLDAGASPAAAAQLAATVEPLVEALFLAGEAPLTDRIRGTSGFAEEFQRRGPRDAQGRSLRDLDLERRLFKYPLSYLVYSDAFAALPEAAKGQVYRRMAEILGGEDDSGKYAHLSAADRAAILEILRDTAPEIATAIAQRMEPV
ncbi:MAG TPA: hypothetical protein VF322_07340 [Gammaproteobacteria bacterium]